MKVIAYLLLAIGVSAAAPDMLVWARPDLVPVEADLAHAWSDLFYLIRTVVGYPFTGDPSLWKAPPFGEKRLMVALIFAVIIAACLAAFLVGGIAALAGWLTAALALGVAILLALYWYDAFTLAKRADARRALEALAVLALLAALAGNLSARVLRLLRR